MRNLGIFFFLFSFIFLIFLIPEIGADSQAFELLGEDFNTNEAKFFPSLIGAIILIISILMIIQGTMTQAKTQNVNSTGIDSKKFKDVGILLAISLTYVILLEPLGFFITTPIGLFACLWFFGMRKWLGLTLMPILVTIFIFICFEMLMSIQLPKGILEWMFY